MPSMKKNVLKSAAAPLIAAFGLVMFAGCSKSEKTPPKTTYTGTLYMASEGGGHIAVVPVTIDPSNASAPITVGSLSKIQLSSGTGSSNYTHVFHDVRLDGTKLYYSAIFVDSDPINTANNGKAHLGYVDLANANAKHDAMVDAEPAVTGMVYCGSGQTGTHYLPMTMSSPAYIDAIPKSDISSGVTLSSAGTVKRTYVEDFRGDPNYLFAHGVNSPDQSKLFVSVNETSSGAMTGAVTGYLLDMSKLVGADPVTSSAITAQHTITGLTAAMGTIAFRSAFTPDGSKILQAGRDRFLVLNGSDLTELDNNTAIGGSYAANGVENHDAMPTPDGKYAILSLRFKYSTGNQDSGLQLYDLANKKTIGDPVSTCNKCHNASDPASVTPDRPTCGVVGNLTTVTQ